MKFSSFLFFIFMVQHAYSANKGWHNASDQNIKDCFRSETFQNIELSYPYQDQVLELRIIYNPEQEHIILNDGTDYEYCFRYGIFSKEAMPEALEQHLKTIVKNQLKQSSGGLWVSVVDIDRFANATIISQISDTIDHVNDIEVNTESPIEEAPQVDVVDAVELDSIDQEICDLFQSQEFKKLTVQYLWEDQSYGLTFIYNPKRDPLFCEPLLELIKSPLIISIDDTYPVSLADHINSLIPVDLFYDFNGNYLNGLYSDLQPILPVYELENPNVDAEIETIFSSTALNKKNLYYHLNGEFYKVLLIHNPEKLPLQSVSRHAQVITWNSKVGIFINKTAPKELLDHLSQLSGLSWWDAYWNLSIHNGDGVQFGKDLYRSWYDVMMNAK